MREGLDYHLLDVFSDRPLSGNPLAVFPTPSGIDGATMQRIAAELNLSETVFVTEADRHAGRFAIRIFTPRAELPFAGHPTIGAGVALAAECRAHSGRAPAEIVLDEGIGTVRVAVEEHGPRLAAGRFTAPAAPARLPATLEHAEAAALLGLSESDLPPDATAAWTAGMAFLFVAVNSSRALDAVRFDVSVWNRHAARGVPPQVYVHCIDPDAPERIDARMFAPALGIAEDPATGAATIALAGEVARRRGIADGPFRGEIVQGATMGRPSRLVFDARAEGGRVAEVRLAGDAVTVGEGRLFLDEDYDRIDVTEVEHDG